MREWIGKEIARYEHGARRLQLFFWAIIAINTFVSIVWGILQIQYVLLLYGVGSFGVLFLGYLSHRAKVGRSIIRTTFDIEGAELWLLQQNFGYSLLSLYWRMPTEKLLVAVQYWGKKLNLDLTELMDILEEALDER